MSRRIQGWRVFVLAAALLMMALAMAGCGDAAGDSAPDFSLTNAVGDSVALADYTGTPVLLFFHMADG